MKRRPGPLPPDAVQAPNQVPALMAQCLGGRLRPAARAIDQQGWWEYVAAESCDARMAGVLLNRLEASGVALPPSALRQMRVYRDHVAAAGAAQVGSVSRVLARLQLAGLPFLLLKGAALNATVYSAGERPMTDIDVLIRPADAADADRVLQNAGCRRGPDLVREDFYPRYYCEREYYTRGHPGVKIDLHCRPFHLLRYARTVPEGAMWRDAMEVKLGDLSVPVPGPGAMLAHLAVHAACHGGGHLRWLYDLKAWMDCYGHRIDLDRFAADCRRWRLSLPVNRALATARDAFGESPDSLLGRAAAATRCWAGPFDRIALAAAPLAASAPVLHTLGNALTAPGIRFRLGYLAAVLLPGPGHLAQLYPRRHPGWQVVAHAMRLRRSLGRLLSPDAAM